MSDQADVEIAYLLWWEGLDDEEFEFSRSLPSPQTVEALRSSEARLDDGPPSE